MLGKRFYKKDYIQEEYTECANWCNRNNATIEDMGTYYECVAIVVPLSNIKEMKINDLKTARDTEEQSPIEYNGYRWDFDDKAIQRINGAIIALSNGGEIVWTSADDEEIRGVTADDLRGVISASAVRSNALHVKYRQLRERVEQCTTQADVEAIEW